MRIATPLRAFGLAVLGLGVSLSLIFGSSPPVEAHVPAPQVPVSALPMPDAASSDSWGSVDSNCGGEGAITAKNTYSFRNKKEDPVSRQSVGTITVAKHRKKNTFLIRANNATGKKQKMEITGYAYDHGKNLFADKGKVESYVGCVVITLEAGQELSFNAKITVARKGPDRVYHRNLNGFKHKTG